MTPRFSLHLDFVRALAAIVVLLSHWAYPRFTGGSYILLRDLNLGSDAVVLFFVLSGIVIAYSVETKDRSAGQYLFSRATRLYSVAIPALLATFLFDRIGAALDPEAYAGWWYAPAGLGQTLLIGLSFANEWGLGAFRLGTNGPYWSLSYEVAYYLLFGALVFLSGWRRMAALVVLLAVIGPRALLLLPIWLLGVGLWRLITRDRLQLGRVPAALLATVPVAAYLVFLAIDLPELLMGLTEAALGLDQDAVSALLRFSNEVLWNSLIGGLAFAHFLGVAQLCKSARPLPKGIAVGAIRYFAGASFSIYLIHYPALQLANVLIPEELAAPIRDPLLLVTVLLVCLGFASLFERRLKQFRGLLRAAASRVAGPTPAYRSPAGT